MSLTLKPGNQVTNPSNPRRRGGPEDRYRNNPSASPRRTYVPREGGGYTEENIVPGNETPGSVTAEGNSGLAESRRIQEAQKKIEEQKNEQQKRETAQRVIRELNESAERSRSNTRFNLKSDEQGNLYIQKTTTEQNGSRANTGRRDSVDNNANTAGSGNLESDRTNQGTYTEAPKRTIADILFNRKKQERYQTKRITSPPGSPQQIYYFVGGFVTRLPESFFNTIKGVVNIVNPNSEKNTVVQTGKTLYETGKETITEKDPTVITEKLLFEPFRENPEKFSSQLATDIAAGEVIKRTGIKAKDAYVRAGSEYVPPEKVFSPQVLDDGNQFPLSRSVEESIARFNEVDSTGQIKVNTASPAGLSGDTVGAGKKGGLPVPLEDPGLYVSPRGEASPAFLRIDETPGTYSLNPLKIIEPGVPTVTEFGVRKVSQQPREVVLTPGFQSTKDFLESRAGNAEAYITKRSEIGQGNIPRQDFKATADFESPIARTVVRDGQVIERTTQIKQGDILREAGTTELEAVIPPGTTFEYKPETAIGKIKGFEKYTEYKGRAVAIRDAKIIEGEIGAPTTPGSSIINDKQLREESSYLSQISEPKEKSIGTPVSKTSVGPERSTINNGSRPNSEASSSPKTSKPRSFVESETSIPSYETSPKSFTDYDKSKPFGGSSNPPPNKGGSSIPPPGESSRPFGGSSNPPPNRGGGSGRGGSGTPRPVIPPPAPPQYRPFGKEEKETPEDAYRVFVRRKGEFRAVASKPLTKAQALALGKKVVENTAARSFTIKRTGGRAFGDVETPSFKDFYRSKKERDVLIQKAEKSISTVGELREITFKGIEANRGRRR